MKVLAERSNRIFIVGPIILVVTAFIVNFMMRRGYFKLYYLTDGELTVLGSAFTAFIATIFNLVERACMPRILIEYDNVGIYIYKYKGREPIILRYENIWAFSTDVEYGSEDIMVKSEGYEKISVKKRSSTGTLKIHAQDNYIRVRGIKNIKSVEKKLDKLRDDYMRLRNERYDAIIEQKRREEELAELAKHDPNT